MGVISMADVRQAMVHGRQVMVHGCQAMAGGRQTRVAFRVRCPLTLP